MESAAPLIDRFARPINYLRLSVTDRCNLRCVYCMPEEGLPLLGHTDMLTYEELVRCARIAVRLGVRKIRVTGGEPLVRLGLDAFLAELAALPGLLDLALTTNGTLLAERADGLRRAGLRRVNISLDTLREERFRAITRRPGLQRVLDGIAAAEAAGLAPIKINVVTLRDRNLDEVADFAALTLTRPLTVRFIEHMPAGGCGGWDRTGVVTGATVLEHLRRAYRLEETPSADPGSSNCRDYRIVGATGRIGLISPLSDHFCHSCNRLRIAADGRLRGCLFSGRETDLRAVLRGGGDDDVLLALFRAAVADKPEGLSALTGVPSSCRPGMSRLGG